MMRHPTLSIFFFFNDTATTEIYTLSLHDALPIPQPTGGGDRNAIPLYKFANARVVHHFVTEMPLRVSALRDRKSTRLNSSHLGISYAVFCLKKKKYIAHLHTCVVSVVCQYSLTSM